MKGSQKLELHIPDKFWSKMNPKLDLNEKLDLSYSICLEQCQNYLIPPNYVNTHTHHSILLVDFVQELSKNMKRFDVDQKAKKVNWNLFNDLKDILDPLNAKYQKVRSIYAKHCPSLIAFHQFTNSQDQITIGQFIQVANNFQFDQDQNVITRGSIRFMPENAFSLGVLVANQVQDMKVYIQNLTQTLQEILIAFPQIQSKEITAPVLRAPSQDKKVPQESKVKKNTSSFLQSQMSRMLNDQTLSSDNNNKKELISNLQMNQQYDNIGDKSLERRLPEQFALNEQIEVVRYYLMRGSISATSKQYLISPRVVKLWCQKYQSVIEEQERQRALGIFPNMGYQGFEKCEIGDDEQFESYYVDDDEEIKPQGNLLKSIDEKKDFQQDQSENFQSELQQRKISVIELDSNDDEEAENDKQVETVKLQASEKNSKNNSNTNGQNSIDQIDDQFSFSEDSDVSKREKLKFSVLNIQKMNNLKQAKEELHTENRVINIADKFAEKHENKFDMSSVSQISDYQTIKQKMKTQMMLNTKKSK